MLILLALLAVVTAVLLVRAIWQARRSGDWGTLFAVLAAVLVLALAALAATGRLNWIAALAAAFIPFIRRLLGLLQYLPLIRRLFGAGATGSRPGATGGARRPAAGMSRDQALEILGLGPRPSREDIVGAHRRLMQKVHPDRGGTNFLAQQLNEAKRILLDDLPPE